LPEDAVEVSTGFYQEGDDYYITNKTGLIYFRDYVNGRTGRDCTTYAFVGKTVYLLADITMNDDDGFWTPIGYCGDEGQKDNQLIGTSGKRMFAGAFDGDGHTVSNLEFHDTEGGEFAVGFFGCIKAGGVKIKNLTLENVNFTSTGAGSKFSKACVGGIVGSIYNKAISIDNCHVTGDIHISGTTSVGGIAGLAWQTNDCSVKGNTGSTISGGWYAGGLLGYGAYPKTPAATVSGGVSGVTVSSTVCAGSIIGFADTEVTLEVTEGQDVAVAVGGTPVTKKIGNAEAAIGTHEYLSLAEAVAAAAQDGDTITLLADVALSAPLNVEIEGKAITLDLNNKTLTGRTNLKAGTLTIQNGTVAGGNQQALNVYGSSDTSATNYSVLNIESNVNVTANEFGVCLFGKTATTNGYGAVINIAGTIHTVGSGSEGAVFVSGNLGNNILEGYNNNVINITGEITSDTDTALALNGLAQVNIENGAQLTGDTAVTIKRGFLNVNGGTLTSTGEKDYPGSPNYSGSEMTGAGISMTDTYNKYGPMAVNVTGGTITSTHADAIYKKDATYDNAATITVSGGTFSTEPDAEYVATNYVAVKNDSDNTWTVKAAAAKVAEIVDGAKYETLAEAIANVADNETIKLLDDVTLSEKLVINNGKTFTLDLGGHTLTGPSGRTFDLENAFVTVKNGTMTGSSQPWNVYGSKESSYATGSYNSLTIANDVIVNGKYAVILWYPKYGDPAYGTLINVDGATLNGNIWVLGTIAEGNSEINVKSGTHISVESSNGDDAVGIALQGYATVNVEDGVTISAPTGIEVAGGILNVNGGTITGTASPTNVTAVFNGTTTVGAGIAVAPYGYSTPTVNIRGGAISGYTAFNEANIRKVTNEFKTPAISIEGGTFTVNNDGEKAVHSADGLTGFISGGKFSTKPDTGYVAEGYTANETGDYWIVDKAAAQIEVTSGDVVSTKDKTLEQVIAAATTVEDATDNSSATQITVNNTVVLGDTGASQVTVAEGSNLQVENTASRNTGTKTTTAKEVTITNNGNVEKAIVITSTTTGDDATTTTIAIPETKITKDETVVGDKNDAKVTDFVDVAEAILKAADANANLDPTTVTGFALKMKQETPIDTAPTGATALSTVLSTYNSRLLGGAVKVYPEATITTTVGSTTSSYTYNAAAESAGKTYVTTISVPDAEAGDVIDVLHISDDGKTLLPTITDVTVTENGQATFTHTGCSYFLGVEQQSSEFVPETFGGEKGWHANFVDYQFGNVQDSIYMNVVLYVNTLYDTSDKIDVNNGAVKFSFLDINETVALADFEPISDDTTLNTKSALALATNGYYCYKTGSVYVVRVKVFPYQISEEISLQLLKNGSAVKLYKNTSNESVFRPLSGGTTVDWDQIKAGLLTFSDTNTFKMSMRGYLTNYSGQQGAVAEALLAYGDAAEAVWYSDGTLKPKG